MGLEKSDVEDGNDVVMIHGPDMEVEEKKTTVEDKEDQIRRKQFAKMTHLTSEMTEISWVFSWFEE